MSVSLGSGPLWFLRIYGGCKLKVTWAETLDEELHSKEKKHASGKTSFKIAQKNPNTFEWFKNSGEMGFYREQTAERGKEKKPLRRL